MLAVTCLTRPSRCCTGWATLLKARSLGKACILMPRGFLYRIRDMTKNNGSLKSRRVQISDTFSEIQDY